MSGHRPFSELRDQLPARTYQCFIDGCRNVATLNRADYPDNVHLCDEHRYIDEEDVW